MRFAIAKRNSGKAAFFAGWLDVATPSFHDDVTRAVLLDDTAKAQTVCGMVLASSPHCGAFVVAILNHDGLDSWLAFDEQQKTISMLREDLGKVTAQAKALADANIGLYKKLEIKTEEYQEAIREFRAKSDAFFSTEAARRLGEAEKTIADLQRRIGNVASERDQLSEWRRNYPWLKADYEKLQAEYKRLSALVPQAEAEGETTCEADA